MTATDTNSATEELLCARGVVKQYRGGDGSEVRVLQGVDLSIARGEMVAVVGASGSGKSTLLHVLGALERPTNGTIAVAGRDVSTMDDEALAALRNERVGFVFQFHHLLKEFSALENVMMPLRIAGREGRAARERAQLLLDLVGLTSRASHRPAEMSGGEQQRTAVARALAMEPSVLLADEPSGNLDHMTAESLHDLLVRVVREVGVAAVVVTHNRSLAARADRILLLADGRLADTTGKEGAV
ncbi:MAG: ABC transporter ATP-binding protein [Gemmatimonadetes bacterium]|nr:ABC transporter ATP-binding protein [Gemmatimonadota bacterium]